MVNINSLSQAVDVLEINFNTAKKAGKVKKTEIFDRARAKQIIVKPGRNGNADRCVVYYTTPTGEEDTRILRSHDYPALVTN